MPACPIYSTVLWALLKCFIFCPSLGCLSALAGVTALPRCADHIYVICLSSVIKANLLVSCGKASLCMLQLDVAVHICTELASSSHLDLPLDASPSWWRPPPPLHNVPDHTGQIRNNGRSCVVLLTALSFWLNKADHITHENLFLVGVL